MNKPIIGISCNFKPHEGENGTFNLDKSYTDAVYKNGGIPQIIPIMPIESIPALLRLYDGILLSGGGGLLPHIEEMEVLPGLHEQNPIRYEFERELIKHALDMEIPLLGICRGHQMINEVLGGTLVNLPDKNHLQTTPGEQTSHQLVIESDTLLYQATEGEAVEVNSFHSQAIDKLGDNLKIAAYSQDRVIEAVEGTSSNFILGLQFHPEFRTNDEKMMNIYNSFVHAAKDFKHKYIEESS